MKKRWMLLLLSILLLSGMAMLEVSAAGETVSLPCANPEYSLRTLDGGQITTKAEGKPKVLVFFKKGCFNCQYMLRLFRDTTRNLDAVDVIAAEFASADWEETQAFYDEYGTEKLTYCYGASLEGWRYINLVLPGSMGITTPLVIYVDSNNQIVQYSTGMDWEILNHIEEYLSVSLPEPDEGNTPEPGDGGTTEPDEGNTPEPGDGGTTEPDKGNTPEPDNDSRPEHQHQYEETVQKATLDTDGSVTKKCVECGDVAEIRTIFHPNIIELSKTSYTYNGKAKKPSVTVKDSSGKTLSGSCYSVTYSNNKKIGKASVTVNLKGNYSGTVKKSFTIQPKGTSLQKITGKTKGFSVKWKKQTNQTDGYQIQYTTSSKFTKSKTKTITVSKSKTTEKTVSKLKAKKKYYVRIRTFKNVKVNGKTTKIYSEWSKARTVVTKK